MALVILSKTGTASEGYAYPDSAKITLNWQLSGDTVTVLLTNQGASPVQQSSVTDITDSAVSLLSCQVDGIPSQSVNSLSLLGSVYPGEITTSWATGGFTQSVELKYVSAGYRPGNLSWEAFTNFPMFGLADTVATPGGCCVGMRGNIDDDSGDVTDISDLIYFVDYMFNTPAGPAPVCFDEADLNGDGTLDVADLIDLVDYTFGGGGPLPACP